MKSIFPCLISALLVCILFSGCKKDTDLPDNDTPDIDKVHLPPIVNAGVSQTITLPVDSVKLAGTATDTASRIVAYLWAPISGPKPPLFSAQGSATTEVTGLVAGTYVFQLLATDTFGLTGVDTMQVTVLAPSIVTLSPSHNPFEFDYLGYAGTNVDGSPGPNSPELGAEAWTIGTTVFVRAAFGFDLSSLPANVPIKSAKLTLFSDPTPVTGNLSTPNAGSANAMYIRRISSFWNPSLTTWPTQPGTDTTGQVLIPHTNLTSLDLVGVDVTSMVKTMISSGNNYGFMIQLQNEVIYNSRIFCSSKYADQSKRPQLVINY